MLYLLGHIVVFLILAAAAGFALGWVLRGRMDARFLSRQAALLSLFNAMGRAEPVDPPAGAERRRRAEEDEDRSRRLEASTEASS